MCNFVEVIKFRMELFQEGDLTYTLLLECTLYVYLQMKFEQVAVTLVFYEHRAGGRLRN
ncbi:hypothetical protein BCSJ1_19623 [Bacillus cereus SJ1]|nr:hypothetical protein BCSJ1_19623 [Bacillus cereus SJ1]